MSIEQKSSAAPAQVPPLGEVLEAHAKIEAQVGDIYVVFAATFGHNPELRALWSQMALEEGGHAALLRAINKGLFSGLFQAKSFLLPLELMDPLAARIAEYHRQASAITSLDQALRITWEIECSELDFLRELLTSSSNMAELGFPMPTESKDQHIGRLREVILHHTTDPGLRREAKFMAAERFPH